MSNSIKKTLTINLTERANVTPQRDIINNLILNYFPEIEINFNIKKGGKFNMSTPLFGSITKRLGYKSFTLLQRYELTKLINIIIFELTKDAKYIENLDKPSEGKINIVIMEPSSEISDAKLVHEFEKYLYINYPTYKFTIRYDMGQLKIRILSDSNFNQYYPMITEKFNEIFHQKELNQEIINANDLRKIQIPKIIGFLTNLANEELKSSANDMNVFSIEIDHPSLKRSDVMEPIKKIFIDKKYEVLYSNNILIISW